MRVCMEKEIMSYIQHLSESADLITPHEEIRSGFVSLALEKNRQTTPFVELKGGIDPAGADEHWKTAQTALTRIRNAFAAKDLSPCLFFIGSVIVDSMAQGIWTHLEEGLLGNAANLTDPDQVASLSNWLVGL